MHLNVYLSSHSDTYFPICNHSNVDFHWLRYTAMPAIEKILSIDFVIIAITLFYIPRATVMHSYLVHSRWCPRSMISIQTFINFEMKSKSGWKLLLLAYLNEGDLNIFFSSHSVSLSLSIRCEWVCALYAFYIPCRVDWYSDVSLLSYNNSIVSYIIYIKFAIFKRKAQSSHFKQFSGRA